MLTKAQNDHGSSIILAFDRAIKIWNSGAEVCGKGARSDGLESSRGRCQNAEIRGFNLQGASNEMGSLIRISPYLVFLYRVSTFQS